MRIYLSQTHDVCQGGKISNAPENTSFAASFMSLKLRRKYKGRLYGSWGKQGRDWIIR